MSFFEAILLGIIQGLTEFFPISSSGHLILMEQLFGIETEHGVLFNVVLHIGTLIAVYLAFRKDIRHMIRAYIGILKDCWKNLVILWKNIFKNENQAYRKVLRTQYRKLAVIVLIANIPTAILGGLLSGFVEGKGSSLFVVGFGMLITGLLLFVTGFHDRGNKSPKEASLTSALIVGTCQGYAVIPGISRFGLTMTAGLLCGYHKKFAVKYSFLISIPAILGAMILECFKLPEQSGITFGFVCCCFAGAAFAALFGYFAIRMILKLIQRGSLRLFSYYCFAVGTLVIVLNYLV